MYNIGDKIVYPMHGAGIIESIEEKKFLKEKHKYYIMKMPIGDMKVMIPVDNTVEIGIRYVINCAKAEEVLEFFKTHDPDISDNWNKRYRENMVKIKSGDVMEVADVVKSLMVRNKTRGLSTGERKMLSNAKQILISEIVLAHGDVEDDVEQILEDIVDNDLNKHNCK